MTGSCAEVTFPVRTCACAPASAVSSAARLTPAASENCLSRMGYLPSELPSLWHIRSHPDNAGAARPSAESVAERAKKEPPRPAGRGGRLACLLRLELVERLDLHDRGAVIAADPEHRPRSGLLDEHTADIGRARQQVLGELPGLGVEPCH